MANDLNKVLLIGNLTRDPEYKILNQTGVVNFSLANNRTYVSNGEKREEAHFFDCEAWGKLADTLKQYASKGTKICVEGRLKQSTWDTPEGKKASKIRIHVESFQFLGGGQSKSQNQENPGNYSASQGYDGQQQNEISPQMQSYLEKAPPAPGEIDEDDIF